MKIHFLITAQNQFLILNRNTTQWHNTHFFLLLIYPLLLHCHSASAQTRSQAALPPDLDAVAVATARARPLMWAQARVAKKEKRSGMRAEGLKRIRASEHHRDAEVAARVHLSQPPALHASVPLRFKG